MRRISPTSPSQWSLISVLANWLHFFQPHTSKYNVGKSFFCSSILGARHLEAASLGKDPGALTHAYSGSLSDALSGSPNTPPNVTSSTGAAQKIVSVGHYCLPGQPAQPLSVLESYNVSHDFFYPSPLIPIPVTGSIPLLRLSSLQLNGHRLLTVRCYSHLLPYPHHPQKLYRTGIAINRHGVINDTTNS